MPFVKNGDVVAPGDPLCVIEEYAPGPGTYEDDGIVRASIPGTVRIDTVNYVIEVRGPSAEKKVLSPKEVVYGEVVSMRNELAQLKVARSFDEVFRARAFSAVLHISQAGKPVDSLYDVVRPGDVVKAKVLSSPPYQLSLKGPRLGVILAYCSNCGHPLYKVGNQLQCPYCGRVEDRLISPDYILKAKHQPKK
ncbi:exosome complex RNA-binding protein Csl4 [Ignicoccus hospitalis]|uniref:Exosome complex component Csl4 n=1 Tax=Ignicoccus hospitalis (strain KIN4/I / DSM 18386 / JCM 14125) TaxID=453591 RepID=A8AA07_IGNH4|nr:exosome complex RNA-binding protein Csl4 [Ignicoccus hospitalis]ABU81759.1 RNA-binding protein (consists of S1 domain and a Zn-ribbon domain)-like protein [Ignicoccus hospitalis KIN4/I]HIH90027.1 exosome complex RNA-binding protein Csl4 [Desulfurococcaceae archaeon]